MAPESVSKTIASVFHLHNTSANRQLNILMNGQQLTFDPEPVYLGITLDRLLSFKVQFAKNFRQTKELKQPSVKTCRHNLGRTGQHTPLCYSVTEYCCPVWSRSSHVSLVDSQVNKE